MIKPSIIFSVDIECSGRNIPNEHGIVAVGVCIGLPSGKVQAKYSWHVQLLAHQGWEQRCLDQFWNIPENEGLLEALSVGQVSANEFALSFRMLLDNLSITNNVFLISDNPTFDFAAIDTYLVRYGLPPVKYAKDGTTYARPIHDTESYARAAMGWGWDQPQWVSDEDLIERYNIVIPPLRKHVPENDAERIFRIHWAMVNANTKRLT